MTNPFEGIYSCSVQVGLAIVFAKVMVCPLV